MDMPADNSIGPVPAGLPRDRLFIGADEGHGLLDAVLEVGREGPVPQSKMAAHPVQRIVEPKRCFVSAIPEKGEPLGVAHDDVELVTMHDDVASARCRQVDAALLDLDAAEVHPAEIAKPFVVIARYEDDPRTLAYF